MQDLLFPAEKKKTQENLRTSGQFLLRLTGLAGITRFDFGDLILKLIQHRSLVYYHVIMKLRLDFGYYLGEKLI